MHHETSSLRKRDAHAQAGSAARATYVTRIFLETAVNDLAIWNSAVLTRACGNDNWHRKCTPY